MTSLDLNYLLKALSPSAVSGLMFNMGQRVGEIQFSPWQSCDSSSTGHRDVSSETALTGCVSRPSAAIGPALQAPGDC